MSGKVSAFKDRSKPGEIRNSNITAAKGKLSRVSSPVIDGSFVLAAVANAIRTSLGPRGMDKMVSLRELVQKSFLSTTSLVT